MVGKCCGLAALIACSMFVPVALADPDTDPPTVSEKTPEGDSFVNAIPSVQVSFNEKVTGVAAGDLTVNGSAATNLTGSDEGPYTFTGFAAPPVGEVNFALAAGAIKDLANNAFAGRTWKCTLDTQAPTLTFAFTTATVTSSTAVPLTWNATDNHTAATDIVINIYLRLDASAATPVYTPIARKPLDNDGLITIANNGDGAFTWYPSNRPTTQARLRVDAVDAAGNVQSKFGNVFTIQSPVAGKTTLRNFDQPGTQPLGIDAQLRPPSDCAGCHAASDAGYENIFNRWQGSMMANASIDPLFEACLVRANLDAPESGDLCLRCHTPKAWLNGRSSPTDGSRVIQGANPIQVLEKDKVGVSCDVCHRLVDPMLDISQATDPPGDRAILQALGALKPIAFGNGMYVIDPETGYGGYGFKRGPFDIIIDPNATDGHGIAGHDTVNSPFFRTAGSSGICATCHDVSNPFFNATYFLTELPDGTHDVSYDANPLDQSATDFSPGALMPIERTYSEWLHSSYATTYFQLAAFPVKNPPQGKSSTTCADCHMPDTEQPAIACGGGANRADQPRHELAGGNTWVPTQLSGMITVPAQPPNETDEQKTIRLAAAARKQALLDTADRAKYMLENAAELTADIELDQNNKQQLRVRITNLTGHKLPTGYPEGRRMWLYVKVTDKFGNVYESGSFPSNGAGTLSTSAVLRDKVKVYEAELVDSNHQLFHFVLANHVEKDNRIPPLGFDHQTFFTFGGKPIDPEEEDWQTPTQRYADGNNWDETVYHLPLCPTKFEVKLYYQTATKEYITFLGQTYDFSGKGFAWALSGSPPVVMEETGEQTIAPFPANAPLLQNAWSVRKHSNAGEFRIPIDLAPAQNAATTECRADGDQAGQENTIVLEFDQTVAPSSVSGQPEINISSSPAAAVSPILVQGYGSKTLTITFPSVPDPACLTIQLHNIRGECNNLVMPDQTLYLRKVLGDTTNSGRVTSADVAQTKQAVLVNQPVDSSNFRTDVTINGVINLTDVILVKIKSLNKITCP